MSRLALGAALLGGTLFAASTPPLDFLPGVLLGLLLLALAVEFDPAPRRAALIGFAFATSAGLLGLRFVPRVVDTFTPVGFAGGVAALLLLSAAQALAWALAFGLAAQLVKLGAPRAPSFALAVLGACSLPGVFVWTPAGLLSPWPSWLQLADLVGERGVSALLALAAALVAAPLTRWIARRIAVVTERASLLTPPSRLALLGALVGLGLPALLALHGRATLARVDRELAAAQRVTVGLVNAAIPAKLRWEPGAREQVLTRLRRVTHESEAAGVAISIWPEAAYPWIVPHGAPRLPREARGILGGGLRGPILLGAMTATADGQAQHNSAFTIAHDGSLSRPQAKLELLLFGEALPFTQHLPRVVRAVFYRAGGLLPGDEVALQSVGDARGAVLNCYEDTLPGVGRRFALAEPQLFVNLTNDAWFDGTAEPELHLRLAAPRAIEARRDLVRAVNLGVPAHIDRGGRVVARGDAARAGSLVVAPALNDASPTFYAKAGDVPTWVALLASALFGVIHARWRRARPRAV